MEKWRRAVYGYSMNGNGRALINSYSSTIWEHDIKETSPEVIRRIRIDMLSVYNTPSPGVSDMTVIHALITAPFDTPYEGGLFYFFIRCPPDYPMTPPRVKLMTTDGGKVRFNPNIYACGKVCLSILGTWTGPSWSPTQSLSSVLTSIQSLLNDKPYYNEPGFDSEWKTGDADKYNDVIQHETIRVAVCGMVDNDTRLDIPEQLKEIMEKTFLEFYECYENTVNKKMHLNGKEMSDPFFANKGKFRYEELLIRLKTLRTEISARWALEEKKSDAANCVTRDPDSDHKDENSTIKT